MHNKCLRNAIKNQNVVEVVYNDIEEVDNNFKKLLQECIKNKDIRGGVI